MGLSIKSDKGFSLIELMVVVAIIGILSAVAVPQFQKFQRKAKQSEARVLLSGLYTAQKVFLAEKNTYYTNMSSLGYSPEGLVGYRVTMDYSASPVTPVVPFHVNVWHPQWRTDTSALCGSAFGSGAEVNCKALPIAEGGVYLGNFGSHHSTFTVTQNTFTAGAGRILAGYGDSIASNNKMDIWTINHRKEIINLLNGAL